MLSTKPSHALSPLLQKESRQELPYAEPEEGCGPSDLILGMLKDASIPQSILEILDTMPEAYADRVAMSFLSPIESEEITSTKDGYVQTDEWAFKMPDIFGKPDLTNQVYLAFIRYIIAVAEAKGQFECSIRYCTICGKTNCNIGPFGFIKVKQQ